MLKATHGPWRIAGKTTGYIVAPDGKDGRSIVQVAVVGNYRDEELLPFNKERWDSDARLIAAAPELYEALSRLAERFAERKAFEGDDQVRLMDARKALAKARGETE